MNQDIGYDDPSSWRIENEHEKENILKKTSLKRRLSNKLKPVEPKRFYTGSSYNTSSCTIAKNDNVNNSVNNSVNNNNIIFNNNVDNNNIDNVNASITKKNVTSPSSSSSSSSASWDRLQGWLKERIKTTMGREHIKIFHRQDLAFDYYDSELRRIAEESLSHKKRIMIITDDDDDDYKSDNDEKKKFLRKLESNLRIMSYEISGAGKRKYIICDINVFTDRYLEKVFSNNPDSKRDPHHCYEVIREGFPCRMYFDVEFDVEYNPGLDGIELLRIWIDLLSNHLEEDFQIKINANNIVDLDSSTDKKFSHHLIIHFPQGELFCDTRHLGRYINKILDKVPWRSPLPLQDQEEQKGKNNDDDDNNNNNNNNNKDNNSDDTRNSNMEVDEEKHNKSTFLEKLWVRKKPDKGSNNPESTSVTSFIDTSVYSRNRCFRILHSSKFGKTAVLTVGEFNQFDSNKGNNSNNHDDDYNRQIFLDSLVVPILGKRESDKIKLLEYEGDPDNEGGSFSNRISSHQRHHRTKSPSETSLTGNFGKSSPFPKLDDFILSVVKIGGVQGIIRGWSYSSNYVPEMHSNNCNQSTDNNNEPPLLHYTTIRYEIGKNRYCQRIGRPHKSNHIYLIADISIGVFYQKCHDTDCRALEYRSENSPLPKQIIPSGQDIEDANFEISLLNDINKNPDKWN